MKKRRPGRPCIYRPMIGALVAESIANGSSKKQACAEAGVAYSTLMRWQARKKSLRARIEEATQTCRKKRRKDLLFEGLAQELLRFGSHRHNRRPYRNPNAQPVKWMKLIQWWLVHRVPIDVLITPDIEAAACQRFKIPLAAWEEAKKRFPNLLPKVNQKRLRRMEYFLATGKLPPAGWTPPDPKNRSTGNVAPYARFWKR